jgi:hypothetical protein
MSYGDDNLILKGWEAGKFSKARKKFQAILFILKLREDKIRIFNIF